MEEFEVSIRPEDTGARLRAVRELAGLTTRDVARAAGLSRREIGLVERGKRILDPDELRALAGALGVEPEVLVSQGLGELGPATTEADRIDAVAGHDPDHWHALPVSAADLPPALPVDLPDPERRNDLDTRRRVEESWAELRAELDDVLTRCARLSQATSGDDVRDLVDGLETEIRVLKGDRAFQRELAKHERMIGRARTPADGTLPDAALADADLANARTAR